MITAKPIKRSKFTAVVNGRKARKTAARKSSGAPRRKNPATILLGYLNPERNVVKKKTKKSKIRRRNPIVAKAIRRKVSHRNRPRRRNPISRATLIGRPVELLKAGAIGAIAYFVTRQVPQMVLKGRNVSWAGYLANLLTALGSTAVASRYFGAAAAQAAFVGGGMYVVSRIANDQTPFGKTLNLAGIGDPAAVHGMGRIVPGYWASPAIMTRDGQPVFQPQLTEHIRAQMPAPAAAPAGVSGGRLAARSRY